MALTLTYRAETKIPVEVAGLTPDWTRTHSLAEIEQFATAHGNETLPLAELFTVKGDPSDGELHFVGNLAGVHWIGAKLTAGVIRIDGNVGRHTGSGMRGGEIHVRGNAGDWLGAEMHGGLIHVHGSAGDQVGAAYRGSPKGMTGGTILVHGNAGDEVGHTMRRGLIAIGGNCGNFAAINMIAGTVLVFGQCGNRPAAAMRRGTLGVFGSAPSGLLPTFRQGPKYQPLFMQLLLNELERLEFPVPDTAWDATFGLHHGDGLAQGRGEVLLRV